MDVLEALLDGPRARGAFLLRSQLAPPWALRIEDDAALTVMTVVRGSAWVLLDSGARHRFGPGDVAVVRGPAPYTVADRPGTEPGVRILPGGECRRTSDDRSLVDEWHRGVRTWGHATDDGTVLLTGTYERAGEVSRPLLAALPDVAALGRDEWASALVGVLAAEVGFDGPGQRAVLDRLLDVVLITALRAWFDAQRDHAPGWYLAQHDPAVGGALALLHAAPAEAWTVARLAAEVGVSRAALARRFTELVGEPPMTYLTGWRLALAADLLCDPTETVASVARKVGYGTPFALSAAFKRERGLSPQEHRLRSATA